MSDWPAWHCPMHKEKLQDTSDALACPKGEHFPKVKGVPRFVPSTSYADAFGAQWNQYQRTQLDSFTGHPITEVRIRRCLGDHLWNHLNGKDVLEVGCGAGRFTEILLRQGARVTSVDLSAAVEANLRNFPENSAHRVAQADAVRLPFEDGVFDVVFCLGVVQHTPSPEATIRGLFRAVKPGGYLVIDHYTYTWSNLTKITEPLLRQLLKRVDAQSGLKYTEALVKIMLPIHRQARIARPLQYLLSRVSPIRSYYHKYPELSDGQQEEWAKLDTHDALTSWYRHKRTPQQLRRHLESLGATAVECIRGGNGVEVRARRPPMAQCAESRHGSAA